MHQLGLIPAAMHYYKKALDSKPMIEGQKSFDLSSEAAFNLSLIYQSSGSNEMARIYQQKYILIWSFLLSVNIGTRYFYTQARRLRKYSVCENGRFYARLTTLDSGLKGVKLYV